MIGSKTRCLIITPPKDGHDNSIGTLLRKMDISVTTSKNRLESLNRLNQGDWDILVVDAAQDCEDALELLARCKRSVPGAAKLALVPKGDIKTTVRAMKAGATDCVEEPVDAAQLSRTIAALSKTTDDHADDGKQKLTRTERLVLHHILDGRTSSEIAEKLCRSPRTIDVHRRNIMKKLNVDCLVTLVKQTLGKERLI